MTVRVRVNLCEACAARLRELKAREGEEAFRARVEGRRGLGLVGLLCRTCIDNAKEDEQPS